ncbi:MAG: hypothetical protein NTZ05_21370 [Chloroflexi bacterium]|nr:hypothetical protein [Chloroflexota bacterium]
MWEVGAIAAQRWLDRILHPKSPLQKLGGGFACWPRPNLIGRERWNKGVERFSARRRRDAM